MLGFVTRRRYEADLAAAKADANRQRTRAKNAEKREETAAFNRQQVLTQNAELDAANKRLEGRNRALAERLEAAQVGSGFDAAAARRTANRIARLQRAVARARKERAQTPSPAEAELRSQLHRRTKAYGALEEQLLTLQRANEAQARELRDIRESEGAS
jgi:hypothetical protein